MLGIKYDYNGENNFWKYDLNLEKLFPRHFQVRHQTTKNRSFFLKNDFNGKNVFLHRSIRSLSWFLYLRTSLLGFIIGSISKRIVLKYHRGLCSSHWQTHQSILLCLVNLSHWCHGLSLGQCVHWIQTFKVVANCRLLYCVHISGNKTGLQRVLSTIVVWLDSM